MVLYVIIIDPRQLTEWFFVSIDLWLTNQNNAELIYSFWLLYSDFFILNKIFYEFFSIIF